MVPGWFSYHLPSLAEDSCSNKRADLVFKVLNFPVVQVTRSDLLKQGNAQFSA